MALTLCALGHVATTAELRAYVHGQESVVDIFQMSKGTVRCRRGLYACAHLDDDELDALRCGGLLDCVSALRALGVPTPDDGCLHVRFHSQGSRVRPRPEYAAKAVVAHWSRMLSFRRPAQQNVDAHRSGRPVSSRASVPATEAFRQALVCVEPAQLRQLIADVGATVLPFEAVRSIVSDSPRRTRSLIVRGR